MEEQPEKKVITMEDGRKLYDYRFKPTEPKTLEPKTEKGKQTS